MLERARRTLSKETPSSITSVAIVGLGQVGELLSLKLTEVPELESLYGIGREGQEKRLTARYPKMIFS